ncbi:PEP-CTERM sorting domain-containing protein [Adhaeretor mobilis]|uniref:PEP-CTERM protein-sorting domain-containing protein n=1 Tax=Adhaeretor mobilis TaxID=1930276 RepID=A0A517MUP1_9BACT|nr:PEP-CTERM sorting domain-containing protein [Adhaeretor mobilis]QDS98507.1 hypothetical protein HG15A2_17870 [Adhaeretor mobilis]
MKIGITTLALSLVLSLSTHAQAATIIGGAVGNGNFSAGGDVPAGAQTFDETANWFHANNTGANEGTNFTNSSQMGGSNDTSPVSRGGLPFNERVQINDTAYTITSAGEVFSLSYDFGAGGGPASWATTPLPAMTAFLFESAVAVDGDTVEGDMTILPGSLDSYSIDRANDPQWTSRSTANLYTSTAADIGKTVYFGMEFLGATNLFPRIDIIQLDVEAGNIPEPSTALLAFLGLGLCANGRRKS